MSVLPLFFDEVEGGLEILGDVLVESVFECDVQVFNILGQFEGVGGKGADGPNLLLAEELCIVGKMLPANPELMFGGVRLGYRLAVLMMPVGGAHG